MVNNNGIPIEVKKPFETVYEIKNEIPSFEEFMKGYENDANLNYDDLDSWSLGVVECYGPGCKGYWPCGDSRCNGYSSDSCKTNERFHVLYTPCPAERCPNRYRENRVSYYWVHDNSGCGNNGSSSRDKISDECRIRCPDCFNTTHMKHHKFKCSAHKDQHRWTSSVSYYTALEEVFNSDLPPEMFEKITRKLRADRWVAREDD
jgi:hypothetical protein